MAFPFWAVLALAAAAVWAVGNVIDKVLLDKYLNPRQFIFLLPIRVLFVLPLLFFFKLNISMQYVGFVLLGSAALGCGLVLYLLALNHGEVTRLVPLFNISPIIIASLSALFLSEVFPSGIYLGMLLVIAGAALISYDPSAKGKFNIRSIILLLLSIMTFSSGTVAAKYLLGVVDPFSLFFLFIIGSSLIPAIFFCMSADRKSLRKINKKAVLLVSLSILLGLGGYVFHLLALTVGFATMISTMEETQPFFVLIIVLFLSFFFKNAIKEKISTHTIIQKLIAIALLFAGVLIIL